MADKALILVGFGSASHPDGLSGYIKEIISDNLPPKFFGPMRQPAICLISYFAALNSKKKRAGFSDKPSNFEQLKKMAETAQTNFRKKGEDVSVKFAFRYGTPSIDEILMEVADQGFKKITALPLFAHETYSTTGTIEKKIKQFSRNRECLLVGRHQSGMKMPPLPARLEARLPLPRGEREINVKKTHFLGNIIEITKIKHDDPLFINAWAAAIQETLKKNDFRKEPNFHLLFSAHAVPLRDLKKEEGRYSRQVLETAGLISSKLGIKNMSVAYQSRSFWGKWSGPSIIDELYRLGRSGVKNCVIAPISFMQENIETWHDLDKEILPKAGKFGIERLVRVGIPEFI